MILEQAVVQHVWGSGDEWKPETVHVENTALWTGEGMVSEDFAHEHVTEAKIPFTLTCPNILASPYHGSPVHNQLPPGLLDR